MGANPGDAGQGGGVAVTGGGSLAVIDTSFQGNLAQGAVGDPTLGDSDIGRGSTGQGGAIFDDGAALTVAGASFLGNQAVGGRGDVGPPSSVYANNGYGGDATGGGLYIQGGALTVSDSTFANNLAQGGQGGDGGTGYDNGFGGGGSGGALYDAGTGATLTSDDFRSNRAVGDRGGNDGDGSGNANSSGSQYAHNDFGGSSTGGGLYLASGALTVADSTFEDDAAVGGDGGQALSTPASQGGDAGDAFAGAVAIAGFTPASGPTFFTNLIFRGNSAAGGQGAGTGADGGADAGAIGGGYPDQTLTFDGCQFDANHVQGSPNLFTTTQGSAIDAYDALSINGSTFTDNSVTSGGHIFGGVIVSLDLTLNDTKFIGNVSTGREVNGGEIACNGMLTVDNSKFRDNQAVAIAGTAGTGEYDRLGGVVAGGVIQSYLFSITDSTFASNLAGAGDGGDGGAGVVGGPGGDVEGGVLSTQELDLFSSGSAIRLSATPNVVIAGCDFRNNQAVAGSGGAGGQGADGGAGGSVRGGDIYLPRQVSITDSAFVNTQATAVAGGAGGDGGGDGGNGGEVLGGSLCLQDFWSLKYAAKPTVTIKGTVVVGATARGGDGGAGGAGGNGGDGGDAHGGGIYLGVSSGSSRLYRVRIADTQVIGATVQGGRGGTGQTGGAGGDAEGGGLFADGQVKLKLKNSLFTGNMAKGGAGGKGVVKGAGGTGVGGGVYLSAPGSVQVGTTIVGNSASTSDDDLFGSFS